VDGKEAYEKLSAMKWEAMDEQLKKDRVWEKFDKASRKELQPVLARNEKCRVRLPNGIITFL
jgi:hypothetical protein